MEDRQPIHLPNRDDHDLRVYSAIVGPLRASNGDPCKGSAGGRRRRPLNFPEWANVQRMLSDSSLPPHVRARLAPLLQRAHRRWCEAFDRLSPQQSRKSNPNGNGAVSAPTKHRGNL